MAASKAILKVTKGPNSGDSISLEPGSCRLVGRHLSESETAFMDRDGNRVLDGSAADLLTRHLKGKAPALTQEADFRAEAFDRGPDVILADDSISRAHAMVFFDESGVGVVDLASTNGTYVNDDRVGSAIMTHGDLLSMGNSHIAVELLG